jgi:hypothetical protein
MRIASTGKVIIGNTTAYGGLTISDFTANDGNDSIAFFYRGTTGSHESLIKFYDSNGQNNSSIGNNLYNDGSGVPGARLVFKTANGAGGAVTERMRINETGVVTITALGSGTVTATSGVLSAVSDMNLKIEDGFIDNALEKVLNLKPRYFNWKEESGLPTDIRQLGFYAQEVNEALGEEAANTPKNENDKWGIYDRGIVAFLVKAIQEQQAQIEELKALIK